MNAMQAVICFLQLNDNIQYTLIFVDRLNAAVNLGSMFILLSGSVLFMGFSEGCDTCTLYFLLYLTRIVHSIALKHLLLNVI
jgi:hypothetical protein